VFYQMSRYLVVRLRVGDSPEVILPTDYKADAVRQLEHERDNPVKGAKAVLYALTPVKLKPKVIAPKAKATPKAPQKAKPKAANKSPKKPIKSAPPKLKK
jgi:hypothetical protein